MIVVTGAAGFIGSCLVSRLNQSGYGNIIVVDDFSKTEKAHNLEGKSIAAKIGRNDLCPCGSGKKFKQCHGAA